MSIETVARVLLAITSYKVYLFDSKIKLDLNLMKNQANRKSFEFYLYYLMFQNNNIVIMFMTIII